MAKVDNGSMWHWPTPTQKPFFREIVPNGTDDTIRGLTCWKWDDNSNNLPITEVRVLQQKQVAGWLEEPVPVRNGVPPAVGFRLLQTHQLSLAKFPLNYETYEKVRAAFQLPPVERHQPSRRQGASGLFEQEDGSYGTFLWTVPENES